MALEAALNPSKPLTVFGEDYATPDGTCIRDYVHVLDLAQAHWLALEYLMKSEESADFNLGNGKGYSIREVLTEIQKVTGKAPSIQSGPRRQGDPPQLIGSSKKAKDILN